MANLLLLMINKAAIVRVFMVLCWQQFRAKLSNQSQSIIHAQYLFGSISFILIGLRFNRKDIVVVGFINQGCLNSHQLHNTSQSSSQQRIGIAVSALPGYYQRACCGSRLSYNSTLSNNSKNKYQWLIIHHSFSNDISLVNILMWTAENKSVIKGIKIEPPPYWDDDTLSTSSENNFEETWQNFQPQFQAQVRQCRLDLLTCPLAFELFQTGATHSIAFKDINTVDPWEIASLLHQHIHSPKPPSLLNTVEEDAPLQQQDFESVTAFEIQEYRFKAAYQRVLVDGRWMTQLVDFSCNLMDQLAKWLKKNKYKPTNQFISQPIDRGRLARLAASYSEFVAQQKNLFDLVERGYQHLSQRFQLKQQRLCYDECIRYFSQWTHSVHPFLQQSVHKKSTRGMSKDFKLIQHISVYLLTLRDLAQQPPTASSSLKQFKNQADKLISNYDSLSQKIGVSLALKHPPGSGALLSQKLMGALEGFEAGEQKWVKARIQDILNWNHIKIQITFI